MEHRPWSTGLVWLAHGTCKFGVISDHAQAEVRWRLYLRLCTTLRSLAKLGAYCWEGRRPVSALGLVTSWVLARFLPPPPPPWQLEGHAAALGTSSALVSARRVGTNLMCGSAPPSLCLQPAWGSLLVRAASLVSGSSGAGPCCLGHRSPTSRQC